MLLDSFSSLLQVLSLSQSLLKPVPQLLDATKGITTPLLGAVQDITKPILSVTHDVTTPLVGAVSRITKPVIGAVGDVTKPVLGAVKGITDPLLEPVKGILDPILGAVDDLGQPLGLPPLKSLPLLNILESNHAASSGTSSALSIDGNDSQGNDTQSLSGVKNLAAAGGGPHASASDPCHVDPYSVPVDDLTFAPFDSIQANIYRYRQQQSVNLGSWFVLENWMTPSVFTCASGKRASELDVASGWTSLDNARAVLEYHWDTWITRSDFEYLSSIGINTVRLPIGYWSLGPDFVSGTEFSSVASVYTGSWHRVKRTIQWAAENGIGVLVDLHGAPGSQNGQSHSGTATGKTGLFTSDDNISKTINVLTYLAQQFSGVTNVVGIQLLNEPDNVASLPDFYDRAITAMRSSAAHGDSLPLYVHDGFDLDRFSKYVAGHQDFVVEDHHSYFVFTAQDSATPAQQHIVGVKTNTDRSLATASGRERRNLIVGEWSCALTPQSLEADASPDLARAKFCTGQEEVYRNETAGWAFWSYRMENPDAGWSFKDAVGKSLPSSFFSYRRSNNSSSAAPPLPTTQQSTFAFRREHRFSAIHERRQLAVTRGYTDGLATAQIFAANALSKLGFIDQYIDDSIKALGAAIIPPNMEQQYRTEFMRGLREGEDGVRATMAS